jgi:hypothetical protein
MIHQAIGSQNVRNYNTLIEAGVAKLLLELETFHGNPNLIVHVEFDMTTIIHHLKRLRGGSDLLGRAFSRMVVRATYGRFISFYVIYI